MENDIENARDCPFFETSRVLFWAFLSMKYITAKYLKADLVIWKETEILYVAKYFVFRNHNTYYVHWWAGRDRIQ